MGVECVMVGYMSKDIEVETFALLQEWTPAPCRLIDNTYRNAPLTSIWNQVLWDSSVEVVVLLNADVWVTPGWLGHLTTVFADPSIAVAGPGSSTGTNYIDVGQWSEPPPKRNWLEMAAQRALDRYGADTPWDKDVHGFCYAVSKRAWTALGGFDEGIPFYGNEVEFNERAREEGFRVLKVPQSYVWHWGGYSVKAKSERLRKS